jgi:hypothetical protein
MWTEIWRRALQNPGYDPLANDPVVGYKVQEQRRKMKTGEPMTLANMPGNRFSAGFSPGTPDQPSALVVVEKQWTYYGPNPNDPPPKKPKPPRIEWKYAVHGISRWEAGTDYDTVFSEVCRLTDRPELHHSTMGIDLSALGPATVGELRRHGLRMHRAPVEIAGHQNARIDKDSGVWTVRRRDLVGPAYLLSARGKVRIGKELRLAYTQEQVLRAAGTSLVARVVDVWSQVVGAEPAVRQGKNDDLLLAACLAIWCGENFKDVGSFPWGYA